MACSKNADALSDGAELSVPLRRIRAATVILFLVLVTALGYWQLVRSHEMAAVGRRQTLRQQILPAARGAILDRHDRVLAENRCRTAAVLDLALVRDEVRQERERLSGERTADASHHAAAASGVGRARVAVVQRHLSRLNAILGREAMLDVAALERHFAHDRAAAFILADDLNTTEEAQLRTVLTPTDPIRVQPTLERVYPNGRVAAHVIGRVRAEPIRVSSAAQIPSLRATSLTGESGIERQYDARLRGESGFATVRIDAAGYIASRALEVRNPEPGQPVVLSLDLDLQVAAERALAEAAAAPRGGAVAVAVSTGEILAMASKPDFDLNSVSPRMTEGAKHAIDEEGGWLNRTTQALYPPGSTFKIFTVLAGLRQGCLDPTATCDCRGYLQCGEEQFRCHLGTGHGSVALRDALAQSCNVFAYQAALAAGPAAVAAEARRFHLAEPTYIDLPFESRRMLVPDPEKNSATGREPWTVGDTVNLAIGQGSLRISPLQAACAMASLARGETLTVPTLLRRPDRSPSGDRPREPLGLADAQRRAVVDGLRAVVEIGIGRNAQVPGVSMAGKSGTAQVKRERGMMNVAWFVAFAPVERPEIAIAVALEGDVPGEEFAGAAHAAPIVGEIAGTYFDQRLRREKASQ